MSAINLVGSDVSEEAAHVVLLTVNAGGEATGRYHDKTYFVSLSVGSMTCMDSSQQSYSEAVMRASRCSKFAKRFGKESYPNETVWFQEIMAASRPVL